MLTLLAWPGYATWASSCFRCKRAFYYDWIRTLQAARAFEE